MEAIQMSLSVISWALIKYPVMCDSSNGEVEGGECAGVEQTRGPWPSWFSPPFTSPTPVYTNHRQQLSPLPSHVIETTASLQNVSLKGIEMIKRLCRTQQRLLHNMILLFQPNDWY